MAPGVFTLMRKNVKRSIFYLVTTNTALYFTYDYTVTNDVLKSCSRRAAVYGDQRLRNPTEQPRHITVILNPVAGARKTKKLYAKYVEPFLHLAGIKVSLIETESPNQAFELMRIMSNCDGVAIVGGDGTVHEAINGLLHRPDSAEAAQKFPIGIIPTGQYNTIARYLHNRLVYRNQKEFLAHATMRLVDQVQEKFDVLKIEPLDSELKEQSKEPLPIYALRDVRYGRFQDNYFKTSGYMFYQNYIKPTWLRLSRAIRDKYPRPELESINYSKPCAGCSRCLERHKLVSSQQKVVEEPSANRRWWGMLAPASRNSGPSEEEKKELEMAKVDNPECGQLLAVEHLEDVTDIRACMMGDKKIRLSVGRNGELNPSQIMETQDVRLQISKRLDEELKQSIAAERLAAEEQAAGDGQEESAETKTKEKKEDNSTKFLIDGQLTQARSLEISTLSKALIIFTGPKKLSPPDDGASRKV